MPPKGNRGRSRGRGRPSTRSLGTGSQEAPEGQGPQPGETQSGQVDMNEIAAMIAQQVTAAVAQLNQGRQGGGEPEGRPEQPGPEVSRANSSGCSYKSFMSCKPKEFFGNEGTIKALRWIDEMEAILDISKCAEGDKVRFVTHSLKAEALEWWNGVIQGRGRSEANGMSWSEFTKIMIEKYCPINEMEKLQTEFLSLSMDGKNILEYTQRFNALARLLPNLVTPESQKVNRYIWGLDSRVRGLVKAAQPTTMKSAIELAAIVTDDRMRSGEFDVDRSSNKRKAGDDMRHVESAIEGSEKKRSWKDQRDGNSKETAKVYQGTSPWCARCNLHHRGACNVCSNCKSPGHVTKNCKRPEIRRCFECGSRDHFRNTCPKLGRDKKNEGVTQG